MTRDFAKTLPVHAVIIYLKISLNHLEIYLKLLVNKYLLIPYVYTTTKNILIKSSLLLIRPDFTLHCLNLPYTFIYYSPEAHTVINIIYILIVLINNTEYP